MKKRKTTPNEGPILEGEEVIREIMGDDFISPAEVMNVYNLRYFKEQLDILSENIPAQNVLTWCSDEGYVVLPAPPHPMSLLDLRLCAPENFSFGARRFFKTRMPFLTFGYKIPFRWIIVRKEVVPGAPDKGNDEFMDDKYVMSIAETFWFLITYYKVRRVTLFMNQSGYTKTPIPSKYDNGMSAGAYGRLPEGPGKFSFGLSRYGKDPEVTYGTVVALKEWV